MSLVLSGDGSIAGAGAITDITSLNTDVSATELGYLNGVTSGLQGQIDSAGGLVLITSNSFTAASTISIDNCFSSTYDNYRILLRSVNSTNGSMNARLRTTSDDTATNYADQLLYSSGTSVTGSRTSAQSLWRFSYSYTTAGSCSVDVFGPNIAAPTQYFSTSQTGSGATIENAIYAGNNTTSTQYTGISILMGAGTGTGYVYVYGYKKA